MPDSPSVLEGVNVAGFVQHVLDKHTAPSTLIVCGSKDDFVKQLHHDLSEPSLATTDDMSEDRTPSLNPRQRLLSKPTLRLLASSRSVSVAFCPELPHLRAYLATLPLQQAQSSTLLAADAKGQPGRRLLGILNPLQLHRPTSSYSAQGINRTFATAVDAAYHTDSQLVLAECTLSIDGQHQSHDLVDIGMDHDAALAAEPEENIWDVEVSILNVTTKSFGAGERGWMGRTVSIRRIAGRWCRFVNMND